MRRYDELLEMISAVTDECVLWPYAQWGGGYGCVKVDGEDRPTHLVALELATPRPAGKVCEVKNEWVDGSKLHAAHGPCHNRLCCNQRHLSWKTIAENAADKERDGTHNDNENHPLCKLSDADVDLIRSLYKGKGRGPTQYELADQFDCSQTQINKIVRGKQRSAA